MCPYDMFGVDNMLQQKHEGKEVEPKIKDCLLQGESWYKEMESAKWLDFVEERTTRKKKDWEREGKRL
jgi:hypothetical protein